MLAIQRTKLYEKKNSIQTVEANFNLSNKLVLGLLPEAYAPFDPLVDKVNKK